MWCRGSGRHPLGKQATLFSIQLYASTFFAPVTSHLARALECMGECLCWTKGGRGGRRLAMMFFKNTFVCIGRFASEMRDGSSYFVLLIITDGEITDMQQTKNAIVEVSQLLPTVGAFVWSKCNQVTLSMLLVFPHSYNCVWIT